MARKKWIPLVLAAAAALAAPIHVYAATEDGLCTVSGITPYGDEAKSRARAIIASCARQENINSLLDSMGDFGLSDYGDDVEAALAGQEAYVSIMENVKSGVKAKEALSGLSDYETWYAFFGTDADDSSGYSLEYSPAMTQEEINERLAYAKLLLLSATDKTDIGEVGAAAPLPTGKEILYPQYLSSDYAELSVEPDSEVYAILSGTVTKAADGSITVSSGGTIEWTISGITPSVKKGGSITQEDSIGTAAGSTITVALSVRGDTVCPIAMYGTRALVWAEGWNEAYAGIYDPVDLGNLTDGTSQTETVTEEPVSAGTSVDGEGNSTDITVRYDNVDAPEAGSVVDTDTLPEGWLDTEEEDTSYLEQGEDADEVLVIPLEDQ
jgi:hypothetical protein